MPSSSGAIPVLLVPSGPGPQDSLEPLAALLDDVGVIHRFDWRGSGPSSASDDLTMQRAIADIDELRAHGGLDRMVVVGHGVGATLALAYAATQPEHTAAVAYLNGVGLGDPRSTSLFSDADMIGWAARTTCSVYFLHGLDDQQHPVSHVMELAAKTPKARKRAIEGAGHRPWEERPGDVRELLSEVMRASGV